MDADVVGELRRSTRAEGGPPNGVSTDDGRCTSSAAGATSSTATSEPASSRRASTHSSAATPAPATSTRLIGSPWLRGSESAGRQRVPDRAAVRERDAATLRQALGDAAQQAPVHRPVAARPVRKVDDAVTRERITSPGSPCSSRVAGHRGGRGVGGCVERLVGVPTRLTSERVVQGPEAPTTASRPRRSGPRSRSRRGARFAPRGSRRKRSPRDGSPWFPGSAPGRSRRRRRALEQAAGGALETDATRLAMTARSDHDQVGVLMLGKLGQPAGGRRGDRRAVRTWTPGGIIAVARVGEHERDLLGDRRVVRRTCGPTCHAVR